MKQLTSKLILLMLVICFSQCSTFRFTERKYTKGRYHDQASALSVKKKRSRQAELPDVSAKTDLSVETKSPVQSPPASDPVATTDKTIPVDAASKALAASPPKATGQEVKWKAAKKTATMLSKLPFSESLLKSPRKTRAKASNDDHVVTSILSIAGFACGVAALVLSFAAIIDSLIILSLSTLFYVAILIGIVAIACGITTLVMGHGDLESYEQSFAVLAIVLGGVGILVSLIWSLIVSFFLSL